MEYTIRQMRREELPIALEWARQEGWNPGIGDATSFYLADPSGFYIGLLGDMPIAVGSAVLYSDSYAFCGLYIVKPKFRGRGYGMALTQERLCRVGKRVTGIDGVLENVAKYQKIGYQPFYKQIRYELAGPRAFSECPATIQRAEALPLRKLEAFDAEHFPAPRSAFLSSWIRQEGATALAHCEGGEVNGFGVVRRCHRGYKVGPLFARSPEVAHLLFEALCMQADGEGPLYLDLPENNNAAQRLAQHYGMEPCFTVMRMYRGGAPEATLQHEVYGITTFELG